MKFKLLAAGVCLLASSVVSAAPILSFIIDGNTFNDPFSITNASDAGETVTRFQLDLRTAMNPICFDLTTNTNCNGSLGVDFAATGGSGVTTGLVSGTVTDEAGGVAAMDHLDIIFNDFDAGETFSWDIDVDFFNAGATVLGNEMVGVTALVDFSNGKRLTGILSLVDGNPDASAFVVTGVTDTPDPVSAPTSLAFLGLLMLAGRRLLKK